MSQFLSYMIFGLYFNQALLQSSDLDHDILMCLFDLSPREYIYIYYIYSLKVPSKFNKLISFPSRDDQVLLNSYLLFC
jgi:hypothetical protein